MVHWGRKRGCTKVARRRPRKVSRGGLASHRASWTHWALSGPTPSRSYSGSLPSEPGPNHLFFHIKFSSNSAVAKRVVFQRVVLADAFSKGGFGGCSPRTKTGTRVHSDVPPEREPERGYVRMFPRNKNWNEGTFAKTTLLENHPFGNPRLFNFNLTSASLGT